MRVVLDFECVDLGLQQKIGAGYPWGGTNVLGCGIKIDQEPAYYVKTQAEVIEVVRKADVVVAHNATYEAGILAMWQIDTKNIKFRCTLLGAKLACNILPSFKLDDLATRYLSEKKESHKLLVAGAEVGLYEIPKTYEDPDDYTGGSSAALKRLKTQRKKMMNLVWANLDKIQEASSVVADYCLQDVELCARLDDLWMEEPGQEQYEWEEIKLWLYHNGFPEMRVGNLKMNAVAYIDDRGIRFTNWQDICRYFG